MGAASVRIGACSVCTFNEGEKSIPLHEDPTNESSLTQGVETMTEETIKPAADSGADPKVDQAAEVAALEAQIADAKGGDIKALESQLATAQTNKASQTAVELYAAGQRISDLEAENKELIRKIATLEHGTKVTDLQRPIE